MTGSSKNGTLCNCLIYEIKLCLKITDVYGNLTITDLLNLNKMAAVAKRQNVHALSGMAKDAFYQEKALFREI